jgi:ribosomal protein L23
MMRTNKQQVRKRVATIFHLVTALVINMVRKMLGTKRATSNVMPVKSAMQQ